MINGEDIRIEWHKLWRKIKNMYKKGKMEERMNLLRQKEQQSNIWKEQDLICHIWLETYVSPVKTASIIQMMEQMAETRNWKRSRGLPVESNKCRVCGSYNENVQHILSGCKVLAGNEYLIRHNQTLMVFAVHWAKMKGLMVKDTRWYEEKWNSGNVLENERYKLIWDFQFKLIKTEKARRPDLILEDKEERNIFIIDMAIPMEMNVEKKRRSKLRKYQQLAYEIRMRRTGFKIYIVPLIIGCCGRGAEDTLLQLEKFFSERVSMGILREMLKTVVLHGESIIIRKVITGLMQA